MKSDDNFSVSMNELYSTMAYNVAELRRLVVYCQERGFNDEATSIYQAYISLRKRARECSIHAEPVAR